MVVTRKAVGFVVGALLLSAPAHALAGNAVTRWVEQALDAVRAQNVGIPNAGRLYAMVTVAMYDAVNGIDRARHLSTREHALLPPAGAPFFGDRRAAAAAAAHAVLVALTPGQQAVLDAALADDLESLGGLERPTVAAGRDWGAFVGGQVVALRAADGSSPAETIPARTGVGEHRAAFTGAQFRNMTPFGIESQAPHLSPAPPALTSDEYAAAFNDVKTLGSNTDTDPERAEISAFWLAEAGTVRETGMWMQVTLAVVERQHTDLSLSATARVFALVGMAVADAVSTSWQTKAIYFTWRPTFAIREADTDGNPATDADPAWTSRIGSVGGSPEYTSGLSTFAGAATSVLAGFYCRDDVSFSFETDLASGPRSYPSFSAVAVEAGRSRIYQGIHFEFSNQEARRVGRAIGQEIVTTRLRRIGHQPPWTRLCPQW
jgi:hypothetical protein